MSYRLSIACVGCLVLLALACDRNTEPFVAGEEPREPDLSRIFPEPMEPPAAPTAGSPGALPGPRPGTPPSDAQPRDAAAEGERVAGTVVLPPELAAGAPASGVLFIIARTAGVAAGPPLAVKRVPAPEFPLSFELGQADVMMPGARFAGQLSLSVRLDSDGNVMSKLPGDLHGESAAPVEAGARDVVLTLDQRI